MGQTGKVGKGEGEGERIGQLLSLLSKTKQGEGKHRSASR
jgi:hypothetical protein